MADYKILPNSLEAEQSLLGCILIASEEQMFIFTKLNTQDFYAEAHKNIFDSMLKVFERNIPVDFVTLTSQLEVDKKLEAVGGIEYITFLTNAVPSAANYQYYLDIVKNNAVKRQLIIDSQEIIKNAFDAEEGQDALNFAEKKVFELSQRDGESELEHVGKPGGALNNVLSQLSELAENPGKMRGIPTGFTDFDAITDGLQKSDLILVAARPGVGKTSFAMNIAQHAAINEGKKVAFFDLEMSREQLMMRALSSVGKVHLGHVLKAKMDADEWKRVWTAEKKLSQSGIFVDPTSGITPYDIISKCRKMKMTEGLDLVVIDYLQLMSSGKNSSNMSKTVEVGEITKTLKIAAKELNVPIILLSQLSRGPDKREGFDGHEPVLSDLRDSGSIEQDADIVLFLYNPEKYNDVTLKDDPGTVYLIVAKHRNGSQGKVKLRWVGEYTTYFNYDDKIQVQGE